MKHSSRSQKVVSRYISRFTHFIVKVSVKARKIVVKGPRGEIKKDLSHLPIDIRVMKMRTRKSASESLCVRVQMWNAGYKQACAVNTFKSIIDNAIVGVTEVSTDLRIRKDLNHVPKHALVCLFLRIIF